MESNRFTDQDRHSMKMACDLATENVDRGGGPFGVVIVKNGEVIATGTNSVTIDNDPKVIIPENKDINNAQTISSNQQMVEKKENFFTKLVDKIKHLFKK